MADAATHTLVCTQITAPHIGYYLAITRQDGGAHLVLGSPRILPRRVGQRWEILVLTDGERPDEPDAPAAWAQVVAAVETACDATRLIDRMRASLRDGFDVDVPALLEELRR